MLSFASCSNDEDALASVTVDDEAVTEVTTGHKLEITASLGTSTRIAGAESDTGIKLSWELGDVIYLMTSTDGSTWTDDYFEFTATAIDSSDDAKATFTCDDFSFPDNTTHVKFVYTPEKVTSEDDLEMENQDLASQTGTIDYVASHLFLESDTLAAASESAVKELGATMSHANAVMKVVIPKSDIQWVEGYYPTTVKMQLVSSSATLEGTSDNTITLTNSSDWDSSDQIVANVVVCMSGEIGTSDHWVFSTTDGLGNNLILATSSAKLLSGGKRYSAPVEFTTGNYFPLIEDYFTQFSGDDGSFEASTNTLVMDTYGAMGWYFTETFGAPLNLSLYNYLVLRLEEGQDKGNQLRMSEVSYWDEQVQFTIEKAKTTIDLDAMDVVIDNAGTVTSQGYYMDKSNIALVCFWSYGGVDNQIVFKEISLTTEKVSDGSGTTTDSSVTVDSIEDTDESAF